MTILNERSPDLTEIVILGVSLDGEVFRPSNWWERLCDKFAMRGEDGRVIYSSHIFPRMIQGYSSVVLKVSLEQEDPDIYEEIKQFVSMHRLRVRAGRNRVDNKDSGHTPTIDNDRRVVANSFGVAPEFAVA